MNGIKAPTNDSEEAADFERVPGISPIARKTMKVRLIKPGLSPIKAKAKGLPEDAQVVDKIRSWVDEFRSRKADQTRADLTRIKSSHKR